MFRSIETSSASALTASALREHASALDASERDRDAYRDMLAESERRRAETLLDMNRQLRAELDAERAAPPGATESGRRPSRLPGGRAPSTPRDGSATRRRERRFPTVETLNANASSASFDPRGLRAALDEERDAVARATRGCQRRARVASLAVKAASRVDAARVEMGMATRGGVNATVRISPPPRSSFDVSREISAPWAPPPTRNTTNRISPSRSPRRTDRRRTRTRRRAPPERARANGETSPRKTRGGDGERLRGRRRRTTTSSQRRRRRAYPPGTRPGRGR